MANEGVLFVPQNITSAEEFRAFNKRTFPRFSATDLDQLAQVYNIPRPDQIPDKRFATNGTSPPTAVYQSSFATGQQQRANALYGETTFYCPGYWLAEAFSSKGQSYQGWKYEFSVPPAQHGSDIEGTCTCGKPLLPFKLKIISNYTTKWSYVGLTLRSLLRHPRPTIPTRLRPRRPTNLGQLHCPQRPLGRAITPVLCFRE